MLEARNISVTIQSKSILRDVSLEVHPGEMVAAVGPNGAGKSTLLKVLSGERIPTNGDVFLDGALLHRLEPRLRARKLAVLPQHSTLDFPFSALEVVQLGRLPFGDGPPNRRSRQIALETLAEVDAEHLTHRLYPTLSGGEKQRVQLARVLTQIRDATPQHPAYLLLDEPTSSLDLKHQHTTFEVLRKLAQTGVGIFVILHDLNLAAAYASKLVLMQQGQVLATGKPKVVMTTENIHRMFGISLPVLEHSDPLPPIFLPPSQ